MNTLAESLAYTSHRRGNVEPAVRKTAEEEKEKGGLLYPRYFSLRRHQPLLFPSAVSALPRLCEFKIE